MKKIYLSLTILLLPLNYAQAEEEASEIYKTYIKRVKTICQQEVYKPKKPILKKEGYIEYQDFDGKEKGLETGTGKSILHNIFGGTRGIINDIGKNGNDGIELAKKSYKHNMNTIYKCSLINPQIKGLERIQKLIENNPQLKKRLSKKLKNKIEKLEKNKIAFSCSNNEPTKKDVLRTTTQELCKYHSYLEYLREYNSDIAKLVEETGETVDELTSSKIKSVEQTKTYNIGTIAQLEQEKKRLIDNEIRRSYDIFPVAFDAYNQYEANLSLHLLLELIKEDYITFREKLHKSINPINQVVYKIANAMKK